MRHSYWTKYKFQVEGDQLSYIQIWGPFYGNDAKQCTVVPTLLP